MHKKKCPVAACPDRSGASDGKAVGGQRKYHYIQIPFRIATTTPTGGADERKRKLFHRRFSLRTLFTTNNSLLHARHIRLYTPRCRHPGYLVRLQLLVKGLDELLYRRRIVVIQPLLMVGFV